MKLPCPACGQLPGVCECTRHGKARIHLGPKRTELSGWARTVTIEGLAYRVGVKRGRAVRIAFKPRGENIGHHWHGWVLCPLGICIFDGRVGGSLGARGLLRYAGVID